MTNLPSFRENYISVIPALKFFKSLGYTYLNPEEALNERGGKNSNVILEKILEKQLRKINHINFKGKEYDFSDTSFKNAIEALKNYHYEGLIRTNEKIYDLLCLGKSFQENIEGDNKSFNINYIDWKDIDNNVFHVTDEFEVSKTGSNETKRPDIILFVNGIPLVVIECKRPDKKDSLTEAISQNIRNQKEEQIPKLFIYSQLIMALNKNDGKYSTTGTPEKFWSIWREDNIDEDLLEYINKSSYNLNDLKDIILSDDKTPMVIREARKKDEAVLREKLITEQDRLIYSLCRPERLLELVYKFIVFDNGVKKITRYQQYFAVKSTVDRIKQVDKDGKRAGGVIWHTQGSGKSLTMVMLAKAIALEPVIKEPRIILVTDRIDLDDQIFTTFKQCGKEVVKASSGDDLFRKIQEKKEIITTLIDKFETASRKRNFKDTSGNIFILVDESHRSQYGVANATMEKVLPNACYIGFTGTPLMKKEKNTALKFGGIIDKYTIDQAVRDKAVVPLLYEGRHILQDVNQELIDSWFEKISKGLTDRQKSDLKRKFSTADQLNEADQRIYMTAYDISEHFKNTWKGTPFKGQLTAPSKVAALKYKKYLDEFGEVTSEVLISAPDTREGHDDVYDEVKSEVQVFWKNMMWKYGNEKHYNKSLINAFKSDEPPDIIIVVDKLLTGFDAPGNTVLYITRSLKDHGLLQAIARVNRLEEKKDFGYIIDYYGLLGNLDRALTAYSSLDGFEEEDLAGCLLNIIEEIKKLSQRHSDLCDIFKGIRNKSDEEAYEELLRDTELRDKFYEKLTAFSKNLSIALSSSRFLEETPEPVITRYKKDLKFFLSLRKSVKSRYSDEVDYRDYEPKIQKLIDKYITSGEVLQITKPVNIFETEKFEAELQQCKSRASMADTIASRTTRTITEKFQEDPVFYDKFSKLLKDTIEAFKNKRISDADYLNTVKEIMTSVKNRTGDDLPESLKHREVAKAFYGITYEVFKSFNNIDTGDISARIAIAIDDIVRSRKIVDWTLNRDIQNKMFDDIENLLCQIRDEHRLNLTFDDIDKIIEQTIHIAKLRCPV